MTLIVPTALYGTVSGYGLKSYSDNKTLFSDIAFNTDAPAGGASTQYEPFYRGFPYQDHYILSITHPDLEAERLNSVQSYALAIPLEVISERNDIYDLLNLLPKTLKAFPKVAESQSIPIKAEPAHIMPPAGYSNLCNLLIEHYASPIVYPTQEHFTDVISLLWRSLPRALRRKFSFGFVIDSISRNIYKVVSAPPQRIPLELPKVDLVDNEPKGVARLLTNPEEVPSLIAANCFSIKEWSDYTILNHVQPYYENIELATASQIRTLIDVIGKNTPDPQEGGKAKQDVLNAFKRAMNRASPEDLLGMRRLDVEPFGENQSWLENVLKVASPLVLGDLSVATETLKIVEKVISETDRTYWHISMSSLIKSFIQTDKGAKVVWRWLTLKPSVAPEIFKIVPSTQRAEQALTKTFTCKEPQLAAKVSEFAAKKSWLPLYSKALLEHTSPHDALKHYLSLAENSLEGLGLIADALGPKNFIDEIFKQDIALYEFAGTHFAGDSELFANLNVADKRWQVVWEASTKITSDPLTGIPNPEIVFFQLAGILLNDEPVPESLLKSVADASNCDLLMLPNRDRVWAKLPIGVRNKALDSTASAWVRAFRLDPYDMTKPENSLADRIKNHFGDELLNPKLENGISVGIRSFELFDFRDNDCRRWITNIPRKSGFNVVQGNKIGGIVKEKRWYSAADAILNATKNNVLGMNHALTMCFELFNLFKRLLNSHYIDYELTTNDKRYALFEKACHLYPKGIDQKKIWSRAGGDLSSAISQGDGRTQWGESLEFMHNGGGGNITALSLIDAMLEDFGKNETLKRLRKEFLNEL